MNFPAKLKQALQTALFKVLHMLQVRLVHGGADLLRDDGVLDVLPHVRPGGPHLQPPQGAREGVRRALRQQARITLMTA